MVRGGDFNHWETTFMAIDTSTWTEKQRAELDALNAEYEDQASRLVTSEAARELAATSPAAMMAKLRDAIADEKRAADLSIAERAADEAEAKARMTYGSRRYARVHTDEGSVILRPATHKECDELAIRSQDMGMGDKLSFAREAISVTVVYPSPEAFIALMERWPALWGDITEAYTSLINCAKIAAEKKG